MIAGVQTIQGRPKSVPDCGFCHSGKKWDDDSYTYSDDLAPRTAQMICPECMTKYLYKAHMSMEELLTRKNSTMLSRMLKKDLEDCEVRELMNGNQLANLKEQYAQTGQCDHKPEYQTLSHPFRTPEGKFQLTSCLVCRQAKINYHGKTYQDEVGKIVDFLARKGLEYEATHTRTQDTHKPRLSFIGSHHKQHKKVSQNETHEATRRITFFKKNTPPTPVFPKKKKIVF